MPDMNPLSEEVLTEAVERLDLPPGARVLDLGCGKGTFLARVVERWAAVGVGVDLSPALVDEARLRVRSVAKGRISVRLADARTFKSTRPFAAVICLGPGWDHGRLDELLAMLLPHLARKGRLLVADLYWRARPSAAFLTEYGFEVDEMGTHRENALSGDAYGLRQLWSQATTTSDFARYERTTHETAVGWASAHPDDPDADAIRARAERNWARHRNGGRKYLGFGVYLFERL